MQYRKFGNLDWNASALGFGCMRLPVIDGQPNSPNIDEPEAVRMIRHAIDSGVNYFDTAYPYHSGQSELVLGRALRDGYREKVKLATKLPIWLVNAPEDFDRYLNEQLEKLQTSDIDFYLFHALDLSRWQNVVLRHSLLAKAEAALADGRIRHLGFSFHGGFSDFAEILDGTDLWSFCQIQYNYVDIENQAGTRGLKMAETRGLAVVVMEPLMGGRLTDPPPDIRESLDSFHLQRSPARWALDWLWNQPEVTVVLSGMSTMQQVEENLAFADASCIGTFTPEEEALVAEARHKYQERIAIPCTRCGYCMPCPTGLDIPVNFELFNYAKAFDDRPSAQFRYKAFLTEAQRSSSCINCGICEPLCPQNIPIADWMPKVAALLD